MEILPTFQNLKSKYLFFCIDGPHYSIYNVEVVGGGKAKWLCNYDAWWLRRIWVDGSFLEVNKVGQFWEKWLW